MNDLQFKDIQIDRFNELGSGYISKVFMGRDKRSGALFAIKITSKEERIAVKREVKFQRTLKHPNIVQLYNSFEKNKKLYIILELVEGGNLFYFMKNKFLTEKEIVFYFVQILRAIDFIHQHKNVHRDIKPENILLKKNGVIKICDFGFAAPFGKNVMRKTMCGTRDYLAPEVAQKKQQNEKVDVWCLGVLLYEMTHKKTPFETYEVFGMKQNDMICIKFKPTISSALKQVIQQCCQYDPSRRPNVSDLIKLPIFQNPTKSIPIQQKFHKTQFQDVKFKQIQHHPKVQFYQNKSIKRNINNNSRKNIKNNTVFKKVFQNKFQPK